MLEKIKDCEFDVIGMGEVMLRLSPFAKERISQSETFNKMAGGSELNVVSGISQLGLRTGIITKLPENEIGKFIKNKIRYSGTSDDYIVYDSSNEKRLGVYYYESGAYPRVPVVVYDRAGSSFSRFKKEEIDPKVYSSTKIFHISGITLALTEELRKNALSVVHEFKKNGVLISFDVNYRAGLWDEDTARAVIEALLPEVDILFVSNETLHRMFGEKGEIEDIHERFAVRYPDMKIIASTMRTATTPTRHTFTSSVYDCEKKQHFTEEPYRDIEVVDRIGSGDAFVAGALYGLIKEGSACAAVRIGNAMSAVKDTIAGDMTACDIFDVNRVINAHNAAGAVSEMVR